jgi:transcriptional regulator
MTMFVPRQYRARDETWHRRIIDGHPLATLVTNGEFEPYATRLPALIAPGQPQSSPLVGIEFVGHMNRANPHWKSLADGTRARLMFDGPGGFVTPAAYHTDPAAPTWNFAAVHVCGRLRLVRDLEETLRIVRWTAASLEQRFGEAWDQTSSLGYFRQIVPGVGAFRLVAASVQAMFKLSQEKSTEVQESVIKRYEADGSGTYWPLARLMREYGMGQPSQAAHFTQCDAPATAGPVESTTERPA